MARAKREEHFLCIGRGSALKIVLLNPYDVLKALTSNGPVRRWLEFVAHEYEPPDGKEVLLLYPCSAVKPYSQSRLYRTS